MRSLARSLLLVALASLVSLTSGCASVPTPVTEAPASAARWYAGTDWARAGDEAVQVLRDYLKVDTTNPPGNETRGAEFLGKILEREGIPYEIHEFAPGRGSLIARLQGGSDEPPLCLLSHIDVVTAEPKEWPADKGPLSGALDESGTIWGRGALDMKSFGTVELLTMVWLKRLHVPLKRSVILLAVAAEESHSEGIELVVKDWAKIGCSQSVNEGGIGIKDLLSPGQTVYTISVAEKGVLWLKMTAHGESGHGSTPLPGRAPGRLIRAIDRLLARDPKPVIDPSIYELVARVGRNLGGVREFVLTRPALFRALALGRLLASPPAKAALINTVNLTGFDGELEPNVVPSEVSAVLDCRVLPGTHPRDLLAEIVKTVDDPNVTFRVLEEREAAASPWQDPLFDALARHAVDGRPNVVAGPALAPGYTDSLFLREKGVHAYGFEPFEVTQEELRGYHGKNERISAENMRRGLRTLFRAVVDVTVR